MKKISKKKHLEIAIDSIPKHPRPKVELEQYSTPSIIAADLMWNAYLIGDIDNKNILDLGCGVGILGISAKLLGAKNVVGVDIDEEPIAIANDLSYDIEFIVSDIKDFTHDLEFNTIFQNPPFGSQEKAEKGTDLKFINKSIELSPKAIYSFHMASTEDFIINYFNKKGFTTTHIFRYKFPIPKIYEFHNREIKDIDVIVIRAQIFF